MGAQRALFRSIGFDVRGLTRLNFANPDVIFQGRVIYAVYEFNVGVYRHDEATTGIQVLIPSILVRGSNLEAAME